MKMTKGKSSNGANPGFEEKLREAADKLDEIWKYGHILTPGRYVGAQEVEDNGEPFEGKMKRLTAGFAGQFEKSGGLEVDIRKNLAGLGFKV